MRRLLAVGSRDGVSRNTYALIGANESDLGAVPYETVPTGGPSLGLLEILVWIGVQPSFSQESKNTHPGFH